MQSVNIVLRAVHNLSIKMLPARNAFASFDCLCKRNARGATSMTAHCQCAIYELTESHT